VDPHRDGATPQPVQKMTFEVLLCYVAKQQDVAGEAHPRYEAGASGYHRHRMLEALGVSNLVVQPQDRDERGKGGEDRPDRRGDRHGARGTRVRGRWRRQAYQKKMLARTVRSTTPNLPCSARFPKTGEAPSVAPLEAEEIRIPIPETYRTSFR